MIKLRLGRTRSSSSKKKPADSETNADVGSAENAYDDTTFNDCQHATELGLTQVPNPDAQLGYEEPPSPVSCVEYVDTDRASEQSTVPSTDHSGSFNVWIRDLEAAPVAECYMCHLTGHFYVRPCCDGVVCDKCLRQNVVTQIDEFGNNHVTCPCVDCQQPLHQAEVDHILSSTRSIEQLEAAPVAECDVCYLTEHFDVRPCCSGVVCDTCLRQHVVTQLSDFGNIRVTCPCVGCQRPVYQAEVHHLLSVPGSFELLEKYDRWIAAANSEASNRKTCPRCGDITEVDESVLKVPKLAKCGIQVRCAGCQLDWCFLCHAPMHSGITCKTFRAGDKLLKQWAADVRVAGDRNAQRCPKCKVFIERNGGCDHMTCNRCNTQFCYLCGHKRRSFRLFKYIGESHDKKRSILGCNAIYKKNNPAQRVVTRGAIFSGKVVAGTVIAVVGVPLVIGLAGVAAGVAVVALPIYGTYRLVRLIHSR